MRSASDRAHRATPEEVGRAAGLKIRRQLARGPVYRRPEPAYRRTRYRETYPVRRPHAIRTSLREPVHPVSYAPQDDAPEAGEPARERQPVAAEAIGVATAESRVDQPADQPVDDSGAGAGAVGAIDSSRQPINQPTAGSQSSGLPAAGNSGRAPAAAEIESTEDLAPETASHPGEDGQAEDTQEASLAIPRGAMPAPLRGSLESLERQNARLEAEGLERIEDENDLASRITHGLLFPVPVSSALGVNESLPPNHRYCRPWTAHFLADLAHAHQAAFHRPLEVSSAVRTVEYQQRLMRTNGNAAPAEGDIVSPHLTGATIDIAKDGLSREEMAWMRRRLLALQSEGKIDVEEEFRQSCFHITVYKNYDPARPAHRPSQAGQPQAQPDPDAGADSVSAAQGL
jgi:hypothetical protein